MFSPGLSWQICRVVRQKGLQVRELARSQFEVAQKGPNDYVTSIDRALDEQLGTAFREIFPEDGVITEENAASRRLFHAQLPRLWCIDPLDGTDDLIQGRGNYAVMVGLLQQDQPVAGWVYAPAMDRLYFGSQGEGVFQTQGDGNPQRIEAKAPPATLGYRMVIGDKDRSNFGDAIASFIPQIQFYNLGSFGLKVMEVVQGKAGVYLYLNQRVKVWDTVGPIAIAQAAGLVCCDLDGNPISFKPDAIEPETLAHYQPILVGWEEYVDAVRLKLKLAVDSVRSGF